MKLLLIDGNSLLFKAYYATAFAGASSIMRTKAGVPTNAIYSLANIVTKILTDETPDYALVAFDTGKPTFRHEEYKDYKGGRPPVPQELIDQFLPAREMLRKFGLYVHEQVGYEADDIIGTASKFSGASLLAEIYSSDHDLLQLISESCHVCLTKKGVSDVAVMTIESLKEEYQLTPAQVIDYKGLFGDKSDNIPGIPGVGDKTAIKLLSEYGSLENILEADVPGKLGEKIKANIESAKISKHLATIDCNVPVPFTLDDLKYNGIKKQELYDFFSKYEMFSLIKKLSNNKLAEQKVEAKEEIFEEVDIKIVKDIDSSLLNEESYLDIRIDGDNYHNDKVLGLGIRIHQQNYFIKYEDLGNAINLKSYLENESYVKNCFEYKALKVVLRKIEIEIKGKYNDLQLLTYVLHSSFKEEPAIVFNMLDYKMPFIKEYFKSNKDENNYAKFSSFILKGLEEVTNKTIIKLIDEHLFDLYNSIELPMASILADMEYEGILLDKEFLESKASNIKANLNRLEKEIIDFAGKPFNINSPSQLAGVLFDDLHLPANSKRSTSAEELEALSFFHPIIDKILEYRKNFKLLSVYVEGLPEFVATDGRIHTIYNQALTATGRLSSRDPNLQNITVRTEEGKEIRKAFYAKEGYSLVSFDYSQIELRVLASLANVKGLIDSYNNGEDIHTRTAMDVFNLPKEQIDSGLRRQAKVVNFGVVYGMSDFGLANELGISFGDAKRYIERYFERYPEIKKYFDDVIKFCKEHNYVETLYGRRRYIPDINSTQYRQRETANRLAGNAPIQGTAADIMKIAMIKVDKVIKENKLDCKMLLQVHDEVVLEVNNSELEKDIPIIKKALEDFEVLKVKLVSECHYGKTWFEE